jgi:hypothetical protein
MGKHSKLRHRDRQVVRRGVVEMVDIRTGENHLLTLDAAAAGIGTLIAAAPMSFWQRWRTRERVTAGPLKRELVAACGPMESAAVSHDQGEGRAR